MDNSDFLKNNNQNDENKETKNRKTGAGKKIVIICSAFVVLAAVIVFVYAVFGGKYAEMAENTINTALSDLKAEYKDSFQYEPFSCRGLKNITCSTSFMELTDFVGKLAVKDFSFTLKPSVKTLDMAAKGIVNMTVRDFSGSDIGKLDTDFNCNSDTVLLSDKSMISNTSFCVSNTGKIKSEQKNTMYFKNDVFKEYTNMITLLKALTNDDNTDIADKISNSSFVISEIKSKISSSNLFDDAIETAKQVGGSYAADITKESVVSLYRLLKDDFLKYEDDEDNSEYTNVVKSLISALDGVIFNGDNLIDVDVTLKNMSDVDSMFDKDTLLNPEDYNISIRSSK